MSKAVLISIKPKWCELIASGKKTVEVRKTKPKIETPFKVYIYMTAGDAVYPVTINGAPYTCSNVGGKCVIGEFVCNTIFDLTEAALFAGMDEINNSVIEEYSCVDIDELLRYKGDKKMIYGWSISDLVIYDTPRALRGFYHYCGDNPNCDGCELLYYSNTECGKEEFCCSNMYGCKPLKRPPQSWCYVEEVGQ